MPERTRRVVEAAIELAEKGGFEAVRLRDVSERSGVALATLYTRFRGKEDILVTAVEEEMVKLHTVLRQFPATQDTALGRVGYFFTLATRAMVIRPNFARAILRSLASGDPEIAEKVLAFHQRVSTFVRACLRDETVPDYDAPINDDVNETGLEFLLQQIWFANLVGWMGRLYDENTVIERMKRSADLLLRGIESERLEHAASENKEA